MQSLLLAAALVFAAAILYGYVGARLWGRKVSADARLAQSLFSFWWFALGAASLAQAVMILMYTTDTLTIAIYQAFQHVLLIAIMAGLGGLVYYLLYLYTGRRMLWLPVMVYYAILYLVLIALLASYGAPQDIVDNGWRLSTEPQPEPNRPLEVAFFVLFVGPQLAAAIAYALLYRRATDNTQRYRIALVSGTIIVWFGSSFLTTIAQASRNPGVQAFSILLGLAAGAAILLAYLPPPPWKARWGLRSISDEQAPPAPA